MKQRASEEEPRTACWRTSDSYPPTHCISRASTAVTPWFVPETMLRTACDSRALDGGRQLVSRANFTALHSDHLK